ncbi:hypothetical protein LZY01_23730 [Levilactobacillus zymae]|uniref:Phage protein n=1 Tax=Levilactobacillus zymae TaxID=267363 RepID=A0ABQ0WZZ6_9LACO|nr:host-nuclease inhibitor Gam family protein [Levilactobacillus zymae]KRL07891.1 hypothetical protein FD38_GL002454 [Levilactobacillus zymae DSM 19395]QFR61040.1 hypothetical protein LZ395_05645 [Levilactobacillus zymae]GEO73205.1 hypothetical protein LZY01_23730 [Levilactobacillus zymae]
MDALEKNDLDQVEDTKPSFKITDLSSATWAMRKYRALVAADNDVKGVAQEQINSIEEWRDKKLELNKESRGFFENLLGDYLAELRRDDPKARIETPFGTVSTRKKAAGVTWSDSTVVQSLKQQGLDDLIRVKEEPDKTAIKKRFHFVGGRYVNDDGQLLAGATEREATVSLVVKPTKGD